MNCTYHKRHQKSNISDCLVCDTEHPALIGKNTSLVVLLEKGLIWLSDYIQNTIFEISNNDLIPTKPHHKQAF